MKKLTVKDGKIMLDGLKIERCTRIDLKNISPDESMEVVLHVVVNEVDIQYSV